MPLKGKISMCTFIGDSDSHIQKATNHKVKTSLKKEV